jgi:hypothetical protein
MATVYNLAFFLAKFLLQVVQKRKEYLHKKHLFTWQKEPSDKYVTAFAFVFLGVAMVDMGIGHYHMATGTGKLD